MSRIIADGLEDGQAFWVKATKGDKYVEEKKKEDQEQKWKKIDLACSYRAVVCSDVSVHPSTWVNGQSSTS